MRHKVVSFLSLALLLAFIVGCAGPSQKFGRGFDNACEFARLGELRRSMEQAAVFDSSGTGGVATGVVTGINRSFARTGLGLYEMLTFPIPNGRYGDYGPIAGYGSPVYPDSYHPDWLADPAMQPDTSLGFAGGDIAPMVPGSRFHIFDN